MSSENHGFDSAAFLRVLKQTPDQTKLFFKSVFNDHGRKIQADARQNHAFTSRGGSLERSIDFEVGDDGLSLTVYLDNRLTTTSKGYSYGAIQHDGSWSQYKPSPISSTHPYKPAKNGGGIKADPFLYNAWERGMNGMVSDLNNVPRRIMEWTYQNGNGRA